MAATSARSAAAAMSASLPPGRLTIAHWHSRLRLPSAAPALRRRVDGVLAELIDAHLADAVHAAGLGRDEIVCVRRVHVTVDLRLRLGDAALAAAWGAAIVGAVQAGLRGEAPAPGAPAMEVRRYACHAAALLDCAEAVARRDLHHQWAWQQIGLWPAASAIAGRTPAALLVQAMVASPGAIVPLLGMLAQRDALAALAAHWAPADWQALAQAAQAAHGLAGGDVARALGGAGADAGRALPAAVQGDGGAAPRPGAAASMPSVAEPAAAPVPPLTIPVDGVIGLPPRAAAALPTLAVLARGAPALQATATALLALLADPAVASRSSGALAAELRRLRALLRSAGAAVADGGPAHGAPAGQRGTAASTATPAATPATTPAAAAAASPPDAAGPATRPLGAAALADDQPPPGPLAADHPLAAAQRAARTGWGGLLFLLHLVAPAGLLDDMPALAGRTLAWRLHRIALQLLPLAADDPAALAFAGLAPDAPAPEGEASAAEQAALAVAAAALVAALRALLVVPALLPEASPEISTKASIHAVPLPPLSDWPQAALLTRVAQRNALVLAWPGWIELQLEMRSVDTALRRAGLDLDPGWLPWLGAVLRFGYD